MKTICYITHVDILYLLMLILILKSIRRLSFKVYSVLVTWLVKYDRDLNLLEESSNRTNLCKKLICMRFCFQNIAIRNLP